MDDALKNLSVATQAKPPLKFFFCYAHKDESLRLKLERHLEPLKNLGHIITWYDRVLLPGSVWKHEIDIHLNTSDIILLLISPHFMGSRYCYSEEMVRALIRHETGEVQVIPIILRPVDWKETPLGSLQALPRDGKPISSWSNRDEAFLDVVKGIRQVIAIIHSQRTKQYQINDGDIYCDMFHYSEALVCYEQALLFDPDDAQLRLKVGNILLRLGLYEKALDSYKEVLRLYKTSRYSYMEEAFLSHDIADILYFLLERFDEAKEIYKDYHVYKFISSRFCFPVLSDVSSEPEQVSRAMLLLIDTIYNSILERHIDPIGTEVYGSALIGTKSWINRRMTVRELVRHIGHSSEYRDRFITDQPLDEALKLCYKHFLGREVKAEDLRYASEIAQSQGFDTLIDLLIDSDEYAQTFGEKKSPVRHAQ